MTIISEDFKMQGKYVHKKGLKRVSKLSRKIKEIKRVAKENDFGLEGLWDSMRIRGTKGFGRRIKNV